MKKIQRQKVRLSGSDSLRDVAVRVFKDERLTALLGDLNPSFDPEDTLEANTIIVLPTVDEARAFTKKKGFTLGYDPSKRSSGWC